MSIQTIMVIESEITGEMTCAEYRRSLRTPRSPNVIRRLLGKVWRAKRA